MKNKQLNIPRRTAIKTLTAGVAAGSLIGMIGQALAEKAKQGIVSLKGKVFVDDKLAALGQIIRPGQRVSTGVASEVVFVLGKDAFLLRENSELAIEGRAAVSALRYLTGKILSVFGKGQKQLLTPTATIGIRGTACYIEAQEGSTYFCLCYGEAEVVPKADANAKEVIRTEHHEHPITIGAMKDSSLMAAAAVINHTDAELTMLESLVDRKPPFHGKSYPGYY